MSNSISYRTVSGEVVVRPAIKAVCWDLWGTMARSDNREPVHTLQVMLGHNPVHVPNGELDPDFLRACLTTDVREPARFVHHIARQHGLPSDEEHVKAFAKVIEAEAGCCAVFMDVMPTLEKLAAAGIKQCVVSNLWPFPADQIFCDGGLGKIFPPDMRIMSYEIGHQKPEREIFHAAIERLGYRPEEILMVGDNPRADTWGSLRCGMQSAVIDRAGVHPTGELAKSVPDAIYLRSLQELPPVITPDRF